MRRVIRALEVQRATGVPFSAWQVRRPPPFRTLFVGLELPRPRLYARIDARVLEQMEAGLLEEVRSLVDRGYDSKSTAMSGFGYREVAAYLRGEYGREEAVARYQQATRHYARRQESWFRPDRRIHWLDAGGVTPRGGAQIVARGRMSAAIPFVKYQGAGNDFVVVDGRRSLPGGEAQGVGPRAGAPGGEEQGWGPWRPASASATSGWGRTGCWWP